MPHTITVKDILTTNQYGEAVHSTSYTSYSALVEYRPQMIRTAFGEEAIANAVVYIASTEAIPLTSLVTLPDGAEPDILRSDVFSDEDGTHHVVLFFGSGARGQ